MTGWGMRPTRLEEDMADIERKLTIPVPDKPVDDAESWSEATEGMTPQEFGRRVAMALIVVVVVCACVILLAGTARIVSMLLP